MAERLSPGDDGLQLLQNALVTGFALVAIILALQPISGAHINPAVSLAAAGLGELPWREVPAYVAAQLVGGIGGTATALVMFDADFTWSEIERASAGTTFAEVVATLGLVGLIFLMVRTGRSATVAYGVGAYIAGAYYFTSSTSFANPAVTVARTFTDSIAGIEPVSIVPFVVAQLAGAALAVIGVRYLAAD